MSAIGANWGRVGVTCSGLGSPVVSDHEQNWGGRVGVTRFGPPVSHGLRS